MKSFNFLSPKYIWDFYEPVGFDGKRWVCAQRLSAREAVKLSAENGWIYEMRLSGPLPTGRSK